MVGDIAQRQSTCLALAKSFYLQFPALAKHKKTVQRVRELGMMLYACNTSTPEVKAGELSSRLVWAIRELVNEQK